MLVAAGVTPTEKAMKSLVRVLLSASLTVAAWAHAAAPFTGYYKANDKDAKLAYLTVRKGAPFSGNPVDILVFSEKDPGSEMNPASKAQGGDLGDALVVRLTKNGDRWDVIGSEFAHSALRHSGASSTGIVYVKDVTSAGDELSGHLYTNPDTDLFHEPLAIDLTFHVKQP
jgi:hypothetical protein